MKDRILTCIVCPKGCQITVKFNESKIESIDGYTCPRGKNYAETECTNPMRTITSTVRTDDGGVISVKTDKAIPKSKIFDCMEIINKSTASVPISIGDIIVENVFGSNIVATENKRI